MFQAQTLNFFGHRWWTTLRLGVALALMVMVAMIALTGRAEACPSGEKSTIAALTTSKAKAKIAHAAARVASMASFTATLSATPTISAKVITCCGHGLPHSHGYSCANASCPACPTGMVVEAWTLTHPVIGHHGRAGPRSGIAACSLMPDLPPPRLA